ncbi:hypothetical protein [Paraburkholderia sp. Tr-20389]|uniref:hypothetical protein n=1 Tax=Paraburkholderia sp. Tr-20389 TaxID=2703903 RepID=UPI0019804F45|nr:hypothetical protein [Paraburkholderia sp. Tr-20389]
MKREYPLEIENVGEDTYIVMSRGHHDPDEFMRKVREEGFDWPLGMPTHHWVKRTPANDGDHTCWFNFVDKGTRGAFPATYAHEAYGEDRYEAIRALAASEGGKGE